MADSSASNDVPLSWSVRTIRDVLALCNADAAGESHGRVTVKSDRECPRNIEAWFWLGKHAAREEGVVINARFLRRLMAEVADFLTVTSDREVILPETASMTIQDFVDNVQVMLRAPRERRGRDDEANNKPTEASHTSSKSEKQARWLADAMILVRDNPDCSDAEIARQVGKNKSTLSRNKTYQMAATMARSQERRQPQGHHKIDPGTGLFDVEAVDDGKHPDRGQQIEGSRYFREYCAECDEPIKVARDEVGESPRCVDCQK